VKFLTAYQLPWAFNQHLQDPESLRRQLYSQPVFQKFPSGQTKFESVEIHYVRLAGGLWHGALRSLWLA
jgi:hypothetical protein